MLLRRCSSTLYKDDIAEYFGFADEAPEKLEKTNTKLEETADALLATSKVEKQRTEVAKDFAKTNKKEVVPNLKALDKALKQSNIQFKSIRGREGLGGLQLAFIEFFGNVQTSFLDTFKDIESIVTETFSFVKQDFREFFQALDNIVVFEGQDVRDEFRKVMNALEKEISELKLQVQGIDIQVPSSAFTFRNTVVDVPSDIFVINLDSTPLITASRRIRDITNQVNGIKMETVSINRPVYKSAGYFPKQGRYLSYPSETEQFRFSATSLSGGSQTTSRTAMSSLQVTSLNQDLKHR